MRNLERGFHSLCEKFLRATPPPRRREPRFPKRIWQRNGGKGMKTKSCHLPIPLPPFLCRHSFAHYFASLFSFAAPGSSERAVAAPRGFLLERGCVRGAPAAAGWPPVTPLIPTGACKVSGPLRLVLGGHSRAPWGAAPPLGVHRVSVVVWLPSALASFPVGLCGRVFCPCRGATISALLLGRNGAILGAC